MNVDGTEYISPLMNGAAFRTRCSGGLTSLDLDIDYDYGKKAWMTTAIFTNCLL